MGDAPVSRAAGELRCSNGDLRKLLIAQIGAELAAHQLYLAIAIWFERQSLVRWGKLFRAQSVEEARTPRRSSTSSSTTRSIRPAGAQGHLDAVRFGVGGGAARARSGRTVAAQFERMASVAIAGNDHRGYEFLGWFIAEQVEEETKLQRLVDLIDSGINLFQAEAQLDAYE